MKILLSHSIQETAEIAGDWLRQVCDKSDESSSVTVGLSGHLGSGKTAFTREVAKALGIEEDITSPTFVIMKFYTTQNPRFDRLIHIDAYRLEYGREMSALGFEDIVANPKNLIMIEWSENIKEILPEGVRMINFEAKGESEREIILN